MPVVKSRVQLVMRYHEIRVSKKYGRGVYAIDDIKAGTTVLKNRMIIEKDGGPLCERFAFYVDRKHSGIALGDVSLLNHSENENAEWDICKKRQVIIVKTTKDIKAGEQIFINYGYDPTEN